MNQAISRLLFSRKATAPDSSDRNDRSRANERRIRGLIRAGRLYPGIIGPRVILSFCLVLVWPGVAAPAQQLTSPAPGSTLSGSSATFTWSPATGASGYVLYLGTTGAGSANLYNSGSTTATSKTVSGIPAAGLTVYARLEWLMGSTWQYADYTYKETGSPAPPAMLSPTPGTTLSSSSVTFTWSPGTGPARYVLYLGTTGAGSANLYNSGSTTATSKLFGGLPAAGSTLYVRLLWLMGTTWQYADYTYTETGSPVAPSLVSPAPGSTLSGSSATFTWSPGTGPSSYVLFLGTLGVGSANLYNSGATTATSKLFGGLPVAGATLYARLLWLMGGSWVYSDYRYTDANLTSSFTALACANSSMTGAGTDTCTVTLSAATSSGLTISLVSSDSSVAVPATVTVAAGASSATFAATAASVTTAQVATLTAVAGSVTHTFALQLVAVVPTLTINATSVAFGDVNLNTLATQSVTLTSTGTAPVTVSSATVTGSGFSYSGASFPLTLNSNQAAVLTVGFDPASGGAVTGQLAFTSNSSINPAPQLSLSGTGEPLSYAVNLTWDAPATTPDPVAGYNIYRSPSGTSTYQLMNSAADAQTAYVDSIVQDGQAYDYIVESVDSSGVESVPSNMAVVTIP